MALKKKGILKYPYFTNIKHCENLIVCTQSVSLMKVYTDPRLLVSMYYRYPVKGSSLAYITTR